MVLVEDLSRSDVWARQKARFKQFALDNGGTVSEEMGEWNAGFVPAGRLLVDGGAWVRRGSLRTVQRVGTYGHGDDRLRTQGKNTLRYLGG